MPVTPSDAPSTAMEVAPDVSPSEIVGLLEHPHGHASVQDIFQITTETHREFGLLIAIIRGGREPVPKPIPW